MCAINVKASVYYMSTSYFEWLLIRFCVCIFLLHAHPQVVCCN